MTTGIILYPTQAGFDRENTALATGSAMPKLAKVVVGDGVPNASPGTATALTNKRGEAQSGSIVRLSPSAISGNAGISPVGAITITEIGIELEDGTLYAYGAMMAPTGFFKGDGVGLDLQFVLSRENLDSIEIAVSLLDLAAMAEQIKNMALAGFAGEASPIVAGMISPLQNAVRLTWEDGIQRFEMELFASGFSLRNTPPITVSGARAGDDSIDVSNATVPLAGDFVLFDAANSEQVRIDESLELGRRLTQTPLLHTYPTSATLSHTNWVISPGEAVCPAGSVYFPRRLRLTEGDVHRVYIRALTAAGAPQLSWRADGGEFAAALLVTQRGIDATWTDYGFDVPAGEYFWLRVLTPENTRVQSIVACNTLHDVRVLTAPMLIGDAAVPDQPVTISMSASSRLAGGSIARFDIVRDGALTSHVATSGAANVAMTFAGEVGEIRQFIVTAVDDLGNRSTPTLHTVTLADNITPPAPSITSPTAGATGVGLTPQLSASAFVVAGATHASTDWEVRAADGQTVVWQSPNNTSQLTSITVPANTLSANTGYQAWVRYRTSTGAVTAWGSAGFTTLAVPAAMAGEMSWTTPGSYTWTVPDGVTSASALVVDGSGGTVAFGSVSVEGSGGVVTLLSSAHALPLTSSSGFSLTLPTSAGSYGVSSGVAAYHNDMPLTPGAQITVNVPGPDGAVRVIWGAGRSFPNNAASAGTQIGIVLVAEGGGAGQWQRVDGNFNPVNYPFGGAFFNSHPTYAGIVDQTIDGQAMVRVPKYYLKTGAVPSGAYAGKRYWMISDQPAPGFAVHPAFMNYGAEVAQYWVGKYQGTNDGGTKLGSVAGLTPLVSIDFPTMQTRATNRNTGGVTGFGLWNIYQLSAIQTLALVEMGGSDSQTLIGQGHVSGSSALTTDNATVAQATWRGIVGLWGNVWQMVDGLQTDASSKYKIWDKNGNKTYQTTSLTAPTSGNYPVTMATATGTDYDLATVFAPETTNATAGNGTYGDYFYQSANCVAYHGGGWGNGALAGLFCLDVGSAASSSHPSVGGRLAKV